MLEIGTIAALVAVAWGAVLLARGSLLAGALAVLLAGTCFGYSFFSLPTGVVPLTADRALLAVLVIQYLGCRARGSDLVDPKPPGKPEWVALALVGALLFSTMTHNWSANGNQPVGQVLFYFLMPLALYWVARQSVLTERRAVWLFGSLAVFGLYLAVTAIAESRQWWFLVYPKYIASVTEAEFLGRGRGPLLNPAGNGILMCLCLGGVAMLWTRVNRGSQVLLLAAAAVICAGIYSTLTRSAWMGCSLAILLIGAVALPRAWRGATLATAMTCGLAFVALNWDNLLAFKRDKNLSAEDVAESAMARPMLAMVAWKMFQDHPLLGCGYGQYISECAAYVSDRSVDMPLEKVRPYVQHNAFLALLVETGLVGAALFVILLALWARDAWRLWTCRNAPLWMRQVGLLFLVLLAGYLPNAMFQDTSIIPMVHMVMFFTAGTVRCVSPACDALAARSATRRFRRFWPRIAWGNSA